MHTTLSSQNPYGLSRYGYAWEQVRPNADAHLDFGCAEANFTNSLLDKNIIFLVGLDISRDHVQLARRQYPHLDIRHISQTVPLPFDDQTFDSITLLDVIEHIHEQTELLDELHRVLKDSGRLILTVPGQHLFSCLDRGNIQFYWPELHRWYYLRTHTLAEYNYHFRSNPDSLIGCVSAQKRWHEHFSRPRLRALLKKSRFRVLDFDGAGFFHHIFDTADFLLRKPPCLQAHLDRLKRLDYRKFEATNLFCLAQKIP